MFEGKKWSDSLKKKAVAFLRTLGGRRPLIDLQANELSTIIEEALEEGRLEVQEDPDRFELVSKDDCKDREREPQRDESHD